MFRAHEVYDFIESIFIEIILNLYEVFGVASQPLFKTSFSLAVVAYMVFVFKTGIGTAGYKTLLTGLLLTLNFNFITNLSSYEGYLVSLVFDMPKELAEFLISANAHSLGLSTPQQTNMSQLYGTIFNNLVERAGDDELWSMYLPTFQAVLIYIAALCMFATYLMYWLVQFAFLFNILAYMVLSPAIIMLSAFNETRHVFFEWFRSVLTYMLYPVIATAIIYIVNEMIFKLVLDGQHVENNQSAFPSGMIILVSLLACTSFSKIAEIANSLTRGSVSGKGSNPFEIAKNAIDSTVKGASTTAKALQGAYGIGQAVGAAGSAFAQRAKEHNEMMRSNPSSDSMSAPPVYLPDIPIEAYRTGSMGWLPELPQQIPFFPQQQLTQDSSSQQATVSQIDSSSQQSSTHSQMNNQNSNLQQGSTSTSPSNQTSTSHHSTQTQESRSNFPHTEAQQQDLPPLEAYQNMPPEWNQKPLPPLEAYQNMPPEWNQKPLVPDTSQQNFIQQKQVNENQTLAQQQATQDMKDWNFGNPLPKETDQKTNPQQNKTDEKSPLQPHITL